MGMKHKTYLQSPYVYGCAKCKTHLTSLDALISKVSGRERGVAHATGIQWANGTGFSL